MYTQSPTITLIQPNEGDIEIKLITDNESFNLTIPSKEVGLEPVHNSMVFIKPEYIFLLSSKGIINNMFQLQERGLWCGFIELSLYMQLIFSERLQKEIVL